MRGVISSTTPLSISTSSTLHIHIHLTLSIPSSPTVEPAPPRVTRHSILLRPNGVISEQPRFSPVPPEPFIFKPKPIIFDVSALKPREIEVDLQKQEKKRSKRVKNRHEENIMNESQRMGEEEQGVVGHGRSGYN